MSWGGIPASLILDMLRKEGMMWQIEMDFTDEVTKESLDELTEIDQKLGRYDENEDWW
jgi:hypothetical protein